MSTRSNNHKAIAVFGATGGCVLAFLMKALEGEHDCIALARTPSKLTGLLASNNVSSDLIQRHLTIVTGNVKDPESVTKTLFHSSLKSGVVDIIVSGVGGAPVFKASNLFYPTIDDPTICEGATTTVLNSLKANLKDNMKKPLAVVVSTTGISDHGRDIPIAMIPLYHWMLPVPHADKKKMETLLASEVKKSSPAISGFVVVRASLLSNGELRGVKKIRADIESDGKVAKSAIGYMISRKDVGNWIYETLVKGHNENESAYLNKFVGITN